MKEDFNLLNEIKNNLQNYKQANTPDYTKLKQKVDKFFIDNEDKIYEAIKIAVLDLSDRGLTDLDVYIRGFSNIRIGIEHNSFKIELNLNKSDDAYEMIKYITKKFNEYIASLKSIKFKIPKLNENRIEKDWQNYNEFEYLIYYKLHIKGV